MCSDNVLITGGASTGLSTVLQKVTWVGYTRRVFMVAPTYYLAAGIFKGISDESLFERRLWLFRPYYWNTGG